MISREICQNVLRKALSTGADYAEIFAENTVNHSLSMIASKVDSIKDTVIAGAAVRVYKGMRSVMASTVDTTEAGLLRCAESAAEALGQGSAQIDIVLKERIFGDIHPVKIVPSSVGNKEKVAILKEGYFAAKEYDESVVQVSGTLLDVDHNILIANTDGTYAQDRQIRTRMAISAVADKGTGTQTGFYGPGRRMGLETFIELIDPRQVGIAAAKQANAHDFIVDGRHPDGYETMAGEKGFRLSGGEKQRISIARAILKKPEILIFDDSTSALDLSTEARLQKALRESLQDTTIIMIAQRVASVMGADRIALIEDGTISDCGNHYELLERSELYQDIYNSQIKKGALDNE